MDVILDSGAFSAWKNNIQIDIDAYIKYALENTAYFRYIVNLDKIPSFFGASHISASEVEESAAESWANAEYMLSKGIPKDRIIPVFHQGEQFYWLEKLRDHGFTYIGLSPANDKSPLQKIDWLRECMYYATDSGGVPYMRFHGFAATGFDVVRSIPWFSVDSISAAFIGGMGEIFVPHYGPSREFNFDKWGIVKVTKYRNPLAHVKKHKANTINSSTIEEGMYKYLQLLGMPYGESSVRMEKVGYKRQANEQVSKVIEGQDTVTVTTIHEVGVSNSTRLRVVANVTAFALFSQTRPIWPHKFVSYNAGFGLVRGNRSKKFSDMKGNEPVRMYTASGFSWLNDMRDSVLRVTGKDICRALTSYHYLSNCNAVIKHLKEYNNANNC